MIVYIRFSDDIHNRTFLKVLHTTHATKYSHGNIRLYLDLERYSKLSLNFALDRARIALLSGTRTRAHRANKLKLQLE